MSETASQTDDKMSEELDRSRNKSIDGETANEESFRNQNLSDEEKQEEGTSSPTDEFLVVWDGDNDPLNPRSFKSSYKWFIVCTISVGTCLVTCTSSIFSATYEQIERRFGCSHEVAILGLSLFVVGIAIGPMFMSPLSEFYGRRPIYHISMFFFLMFSILCATAPNIEALLIGRFLVGLSGSAFLSVAAGTVSDLFVGRAIQSPMMVNTLAPFLGPVLGPLVGSFINQYTSWRWTFYVILIWTGVVYACLIFVPETFHPVLLARKAAALRKSTNNPQYRSASEIAMASKTLKQSLLISLYRPFQLLFLEPMCLCLCLYTSLLLGILYLFFGAFPLVFVNNHGFDLSQTGLSFLGILGGTVAGVLFNPLLRKNYERLVAKYRTFDSEGKPKTPDPELRLPPAIWGSIVVPIGLFWFGWTTYASVHWIVPILGSMIFSIGTMLVYSGVWTFLVDAYPDYAASAMAVNTFTRCIFAAAFPLFGEQMYEKLGYQWATSLLAFLALAMVPFMYLFYKHGKALRAKSRFAKD